MNSIQKLFKFGLVNFGPLVAFYVVYHFYGLKVAVGGSLAVTVFEMIRFRMRSEKMTIFFIFSSVVAILFGAIDLFLDAPVFFRYEAGIVNLLFAFLFGISLFRSKSLIQEFAEQHGRIDQEQTPDKDFFFRFLTGAWVLYFISKALVFIWINQNSSLEEGLLIRLLIGNAGFVLMMFISIGLSRPLWRLLERLKLMPSRRGVRNVKGLLL